MAAIKYGTELLTYKLGVTLTWLHMMPCVASCHIICVTSGHIKSQYTLSIHVMTCDMWHHVTSCHLRHRVTSCYVWHHVISNYILSSHMTYVMCEFTSHHAICDIASHHVISCHVWHHLTASHTVFEACKLQASNTQLKWKLRPVIIALKPKIRRKRENATGVSRGKLETGVKCPKT